MWWLWVLWAWASPEVELLEQQGHHARARFLAHQELSEDPTDPTRWTQLAQLELEPVTSISLFREALRLNPDEGPALVGLGMALAETGDHGESLRVLQRAQELAPHAVEPALALAAFQSDPVLARQLLARFPERPEVALLVARLDPKTSPEVLRVAPPVRTVLEALVSAELSAGNTAGAAEALGRLQALGPQRETDRLARFVRCAQAGTLSAQHYQLLARRRRDALGIPGTTLHDTSLPPGTEGCPAALALQAQLATAGEEAEGWLLRALALGPDPGLEVDLARVQLELGRAWDAERHLMQAGLPAEPDVQIIHAQALFALREETAAREVLTSTASVHPHHLGVVLARAALAQTRSEAFEILREALGRLHDPVLVARARSLAIELERTDELPAVLEDPIARQHRLAEVGDYEEIVVTAERESVIRLREMTALLRERGYSEPEVRADGTVYFAQGDGDHPWISLRPDGSFDVGEARFTRKFRQSRMSLFDDMTAPMMAWRDALCREAVEDRLISEVPAQLDAIWREGLARSGDGRLHSPEARRAELLEWWVTRTCTPEGDRVREVIAHYLLTEVQASPWPVTEEELVTINGRRICTEPLVLR
jgi:hypothetical protein